MHAHQQCAWILQRFCSQPSTATQSSCRLGATLCSPSHPAAAPLPEDPTARGGGGAQGAAPDLRAFCREALYECITEEKPGSLASYLLLYSLMQGMLGSSHPPGIMKQRGRGGGEGGGGVEASRHQVLGMGGVGGGRHQVHGGEGGLGRRAGSLDSSRDT